MPGIVEIVLTVCSAVQPANCEQRSLQFGWEGSLRACTLAAPPYIAQYMGNYPAWTVSRWNCQYPGERKQSG